MKTRNLFTTLLASSCLATLGWAADQPTPTPASSETPAEKHSHTNPHAAQVDAEFAKEAATGGLMEVDLGKAAEANAANAEVKAFGAQMVKDHTAINEKLAKVAKAQNLTIPSSLDPKHQAMLDKMSALKGAAFDKAYVADMVKDHVADVAMFKKASTSLTNPELKTFATETLPILQGHLEKIKAIQASMK